MKADFETNGMHKGKPVFCPVNVWECPYYGDGLCHLKNPIEDCDDFGAFYECWEDWEEA